MWSHYNKTIPSTTAKLRQYNTVVLSEVLYYSETKYNKRKVKTEREKKKTTRTRTENVGKNPWSGIQTQFLEKNDPQKKYKDTLHP